MFPLEKLRAVGELVADANPWAPEYYLLFALAGEEPVMTLSFDVPVPFEELTQLSEILGEKLQSHFDASSGKWDSKVLWPIHFRSSNFYDSRDLVEEPRGPGWHNRALDFLFPRRQMNYSAEVLRLRQVGKGA